MSHASVAHIEPRTSRGLPDYLPARMINEFVYCPRLFHFEQVLGVFAENEHTVEGATQHRRVDREGKSTPDPWDQTSEPVIVTSITLSSEEHRVIAKLDLAEFDRGRATPVDYKHGRPRTAPGGLEAWDTDRIQLAVQAIVLRANGYACDEGFIFYQKTRQRVRVEFDQEVMNEAHQAIEGAWDAAMATAMPPPLVDSPKCPGCSLVGVCLPDETIHYQERDQERSQQQYGLFDSVSESTRKPQGARDQAARGSSQRFAPSIPEHAGAEGGKDGRRSEDQGPRQSRPRGSNQGNLPSKPARKRPNLDSGDSRAVQGGETCLLLFAGRMVLRNHHGAEYEERRLAKVPGHAVGPRMVLLAHRTLPNRGQDQESADHDDAQPHRASQGESA